MAAAAAEAAKAAERRSSNLGGDRYGVGDGGCGRQKWEPGDEEWGWDSRTKVRLPSPRARFRI